MAVGAAMDQTAEEEAHAHYQEQIGEDRSQHGGLDNLYLSILQSHDANLNNESVVGRMRRVSHSSYNQFHSVSEGRVQESAHSLAELHGDLLGRKG